MAALAPQELTIDTGQITFTSAGAGGDTFRNNGKTLFIATNGSGAAITITFAAQNRANVNGAALAVSNVTMAVAAGQVAIKAHLPEAIFNNSSGSVAVSYSSATSVSVAAVILP